MQGTAESRGQRLTSIDAIRGIAAFVVVISHSIEEAISLMSVGSPSRQFLEAIGIDYLNLGRVGVVAFFCVSGYVIPFSFAHRQPVRSFLIARFFRLYPAYWTSIAGLLMLLLLLGHPLPPATQILANITMLQGGLGQPHLIGVYWTLFYELVFYGLCLTAFVTGRMQSPIYLVSVIAGLSLLGLGAAGLRQADIAGGVPIGIFVFLAVMHLGTLARIADRDATPLALRYFKIGLAVILLTAGPTLSIGFIQHAGNQRLITDVTGLYVGLALFLSLRLRSDIATRPMLFLGKISYSLYLMHPLCLIALAVIAKTLPGAAARLFLLISMPICSIVLATMVQHLVEEPSNKLGRRVRRLLTAADSVLLRSIVLAFSRRPASSE
ncbi:MAG: acyltransferase family protein [Sphingomonadaceae bacterium]